MNAQERLQFYLNESIKSVSDKRYRKVSEALVEVLPSFVKALHETILDPQATKSSRSLALSMLNSLIIRMESSKRRQVSQAKKYKPKVDGLTEEQREQDFAQRLTHISDDTADKMHKVMQKAYERWRQEYGGNQ